MKKIFTLLSLVIASQGSWAQRTKVAEPVSVALNKEALNVFDNKSSKMNPSKTVTCSDYVNKFFERTSSLTYYWSLPFGDGTAQVIPFSGKGDLTKAAFSVFSNNAVTIGTGEMGLNFRVAIYDVDASGKPNAMIYSEDFSYDEDLTNNPNGLFLATFDVPVPVTDDYAVVLINMDLTRDLIFSLNNNGNNEGLSFNYYNGNFENYLTGYGANNDLFVRTYMDVELTADFLVSNTVEINTPVDFSNSTDIDSLKYHNDYLAQGKTLFNWDFDNGNTSTATNPIESFGTCGEFDIALTANYTKYSDKSVCSDTKIITINVVDDIEMDGTTTTTTACGATDGAINITSSFGSNSGNLSWTGTVAGAASNVTLPYDVTSLGAGTYNFTLVDANDCSSQVLSLTVADQGAPTIAANGLIRCYGESTTVNVSAISGDLTGFTLTWNDGNNDIATGTSVSLPAGTYSISGTNGFCTTSTTFTLTQPIELKTSPVVLHVSCFGLSDGDVDLNVSGGTSPYEVNGDAISNLAKGTYNYIINDDNGCQTTTSVTVIEPNQLTVGETHTNVLCKGDASGTVSLDIEGGTPNYVVTPTQVNGLTAGAHNFTIEDDNGCTAAISITITEPATSVTIASGVVRDVTSTTSNNGAIDVTANGGTGTLIYSWANATAPTTEISNNEDLIDIATGSYILTVTDANGCEDKQTFTVNSVAGIENATIQDLSIYPNPVNNLLHVEAANIERIQVMNMFGELLFDVEVNDNTKTIDLSSLANATYFVKVNTAKAQQMVKITLIK